jgi:hypothetical protein
MSTYNVSFQSATLPSNTACVRLTAPNIATLDAACPGWRFAIFFTPSTFQTWKYQGVNSGAPSTFYEGGVIQWQTLDGIIEGGNATLTTGTLADCSDGDYALLDDGTGCNRWIVGKVKVTA